MASIHHENGINLEGMIKYANPLSTGSYGDLQASNIFENPAELDEKSIDQLNKEYEDQWLEERLVTGMPPDLAMGPLLSGKSLLNLVSKGKNIIKSGKNVVKGFPKARRVDTGPFKRDVVNVEMTDEAGNVFKQPFYRSSGTSEGIGDASLRKGVWEPFLGRGGGGYAPRQYAKGYFTKADDMKYITDRNVKDLIAKGMDKNQADLTARLGPFNKVSDEISRLDKLGYYDKSLYHNIKGPEKLNKFLIEQGVKLPFSAGK